MQTSVARTSLSKPTISIGFPAVAPQDDHGDGIGFFWTPTSDCARRPRSPRVDAVVSSLGNNEGAGKAGCHPRPACIGSKHAVVTTGFAGSSGLPCAMVLTGSFALSPVTNSFCHRRHADWKVSSAPGWAEVTSARLDINNGCQDHTTSPSATMPLVSRASLDRSRV